MDIKEAQHYLGEVDVQALAKAILDQEPQAWTEQLIRQQTTMQFGIDVSRRARSGTRLQRSRQVVETCSRTERGTSTSQLGSDAGR